MKKKEEMVLAIAKEIQIRKSEFENEQVETIYFGGGTPSVLTSDEINFLIAAVYSHYSVIENPEITLEANPDDLSSERIIELSKSKINRLSIGIQSFFEDDLQPILYQQLGEISYEYKKKRTHTNKPTPHLHSASNLPAIPGSVAAWG